jgi:hypothetical protein
MDELLPVLKRLPDPAPPSTITATVMARIARDAERQAEAVATAPAPRRQDRPAWAWALVGIAVVLGARIYGLVVTESLPDFTSSRIGLGHSLGMPGVGSVSLALGLGLLVYLAGLFAPLRRGKT